MEAPVGRASLGCTASKVDEGLDDAGQLEPPEGGVDDDLVVPLPIPLQLHTHHLVERARREHAPPPALKRTVAQPRRRVGVAVGITGWGIAVAARIRAPGATILSIRA